MSVLVETTLGDVVIDLFYKERETAAKNFLKLCKIKYYNLCQFFTIQVCFNGYARYLICFRRITSLKQEIPHRLAVVENLFLRK